MVLPTPEPGGIELKENGQRIERLCPSWERCPHIRQDDTVYKTINRRTEPRESYYTDLGICVCLKKSIPTFPTP
mgnify:CR=1 FL=1